MDKFVEITNAKNNDPNDKRVICERDGALVEYYPFFLSRNEAAKIYDELINHPGWSTTQTMTRGGLKTTSRLVTGMMTSDLMEQSSIEAETNDAESEGNYNYKLRYPFTPLLEKIRIRIQELTGEKYNFAYLNQYRDGNDSIGWHSDKENSLEKQSTIASLSLGCTRDFMLRHIAETQLAQELVDPVTRRAALDKAKMCIPLHPGSLLLMRKNTQKVYHHHVPKRIGFKGIRINVTFRRLK
jgi:alkylated DNA repair dioxygenase AlkB